MLRDTLRAFRRREIEPAWEALELADRERFRSLWRSLSEVGLTGFGLLERHGGLALEPDDQFEILSALGAACPSLAAALIAHVCAHALLCESAAPTLPPALAGVVSEARMTLVASPLDALPESGFELSGDEPALLHGQARVLWPHPHWLLVPACSVRGLQLCVLEAGAPGVSFSPLASSHGLTLLPFGTLTLDSVALPMDQCFPWPSAGKSAALADGLLTSLLSGLNEELWERAASYALQRYQGGKMIHEHDAVQELLGPIALCRRVLPALAHSALRRQPPGDGGASAFAIELGRQAGLDAVQTLGGYGYMRDYRVERYLRDANTLETFWIHAADRRRAIARIDIARMAS